MEKVLRFYAGFLVVLIHVVLQTTGSFDPLQRMQDASIDQIIRQHNGDMFIAKNADCNSDTCVGLSSGTAVLAMNNSTHRQQTAAKGACICQCHTHLPAFRDDLHICVDDIHECVLAPFASTSMSQQIPFVFLPLKGQIIHPSKEISFTGIRTPICAVSGAKFLTENGWIDLRDPVDTDIPFRMFRDEGRTFLQWVGEPQLRNEMSGRLVLVHLMCRELSSTPLSTDQQTIFTPCVAFRIVGSPIKHNNVVNEVLFSSDESSQNSSTNLSTSEYVAIGISSVLLGLIYVASVLLYLHIRKRRKETEKTSNKNEDQNLSSMEEGIIKNNPLIGLSRHFSNLDLGMMESGSSDTDAAADSSNQYEEKKQITSALVHPQHQKYERRLKNSEYCHTDPSSTERLPEENVSIVEIMEGREERPETVKSITGTTRRKLYFNPAYFEPQLLMTPPPAAIEFLTKIREVITIAKQKMASKKFTPNLLGIPEEDTSYTVDPIYDSSHPLGSRRSSVISLKRENSRRRTCSGCPGCEPQDFKSLCGKLPEFPSLGACQNCTISSTESKEQSIQQWLDNIPVLKINQEEKDKEMLRVRSPTNENCTYSPRASSLRGLSPERELYEHKAFSLASKTPPPSRIKKVRKQKAPSPPQVLPPPDMINEAIMVDKIPTMTKKKMNAVINEFSSVFDRNEDEIKTIEYETDSLEKRPNKGYSTPSDYAGEISSSQPSPSMSSALPMDEEMTMRNAIFNTKTGSRTISKLNMDSLKSEEHDYELIVLKKDHKLNRNVENALSKLLQRNNGYSLVSEVYVNNGYNYNSATSTSSNSNSSTLEKCPVPGKLLIQVEDCPDNYIRADESDQFEPDTLDRKPGRNQQQILRKNEFVDSLERPHQILLKSSGSFKINSDAPNEYQGRSNFSRNFGSLREIYEAKLRSSGKKIKCGEGMEQTWMAFKFPEEFEDGRLLTLEERHSKRQRQSLVQPDVIPPPPLDNIPLYEHPKPPRRVFLQTIPPKNAIGRSTGKTSSSDDPPGTSAEEKSQNSTLVKTEDMGYLSFGGGSETEGSQGDAQSESGAESVETHSVFFGDFRKGSFCLVGSVDSGVGWGLRRGENIVMVDEVTNSSDSETVSYTTVVNPSSNRHSVVVDT